MSIASPPQVHRWTREEYHKMGEAGLFRNRRVELIEGKVVDMSPTGSRHWVSVNLAAKELRRIFENGHVVSAQNAISPNEYSEPQPDVAVVEGAARDYAAALPATAVLIVEVSDTSLEYDRTEKASLYAKAGVRDYWIINLIDDHVEVLRGPQPDDSGAYGFGYATSLVFKRGDTIAPLAAPHAQVRVDDLLP